MFVYKVMRGYQKDDEKIVKWTVLDEFLDQSEAMAYVKEAEKASGVVPAGFKAFFVVTREGHISDKGKGDVTS